MRKTAGVELWPQFLNSLAGTARGWLLFRRENKRNFKIDVNKIYKADFRSERVLYYNLRSERCAMIN